ncbi:hypothetical protein MRB53_014567 [Persea americana]|uniref:Uncharacterized protein n=1 Tax=Persea americana TaxID=3435 RepID=A0ACC2KBL0_PERAE|nr:hypothetical protein MRB53_014567 [Persea americana]
MPIQPTAAVWGALLGACRIHGNTKLAECAVKHLFELDWKDSGSYVLLANTYANAGKLDDVAEVRKLMRERGIQKNPGCSWIEVDNRIHVFIVDDTSHPQIDDVHRMLDEVLKNIEEMGLPIWMPITVIKLMSLVTARELIVRDATRFHHIKNGACSCGDYWRIE